MKPYIKAILFLAILFLLELVFKGGMLPFPIPFALPQGYAPLLLFSIFAFLAWFITKRFVKSDQSSMKDLGISCDTKNRRDFYYGVLIGIFLWAIVSLVQSWAAGFSWELRPDISLYNLVFGFIFIFIADLGTELFYRGYGLTRFKDSFGPNAAIGIMTLFVGLKSYSFGMDSELMLYAIIIPALHTVFFSIIYFKTKRLGAALGIHTGANFVTISIFDLREAHPNQAIPSGVFQSNTDLETLSMTAIQFPWVLMAVFFSIVCYFWWQKSLKA